MQRSMYNGVIKHGMYFIIKYYHKPLAGQQSWHDSSYMHYSMPFQTSLLRNIQRITLYFMLYIVIACILFPLFLY